MEVIFGAHWLWWYCSASAVESEGDFCHLHRGNTAWMAPKRMLVVVLTAVLCVVRKMRLVPVDPSIARALFRCAFHLSRTLGGTRHND